MMLKLLKAVVHKFVGELSEDEREQFLEFVIRAIATVSEGAANGRD